MDAEQPQKPLVEDLADVLVRMVVGWEYEFGFDLAKHPEVVRVMRRYREEHVANPGVVREGGYLCICLGGRYSVKYGCIATGLGKEN
jgi:hypothetical protein